MLGKGEDNTTIYAILLPDMSFCGGQMWLDRIEKRLFLILVVNQQTKSMEIFFKKKDSQNTLLDKLGSCTNYIA